MNLTDVCLGKNPRKIDSRTLQLKNFTAVPPQRPPKKKSWLTGIPSIPIYKNDVLGCCVISMMAHMLDQWSYLTTGKIIGFTDQQIIEMYTAIGGYDPNAPLNPDGSNPTDNGCVMLDALNYWRETGFCGYKMEAYVSANPRSPTEFEQAIALFGNTAIGVELPVAVQGSSTWDNPPNLTGDWAPGSWGGHAIPAGAYWPGGHGRQAAGGAAAGGGGTGPPAVLFGGATAAGVSGLPPLAGGGSRQEGAGGDVASGGGSVSPAEVRVPSAPVAGAAAARSPAALRAPTYVPLAGGAGPALATAKVSPGTGPGCVVVAGVSGGPPSAAVVPRPTPADSEAAAAGGGGGDADSESRADEVRAEGAVSDSDVEPSAMTRTVPLVPAAAAPAASGAAMLDVTETPTCVWAAVPCACRAVSDAAATEVGTGPPGWLGGVDGCAGRVTGGGVLLAAAAAATPSDAAEPPASACAVAACEGDGGKSSERAPAVADAGQAAAAAATEVRLGDVPVRAGGEPRAVPDTGTEAVGLSAGRCKVVASIDFS